MARNGRARWYCNCGMKPVARGHGGGGEKLIHLYFRRVAKRNDETCARRANGRAAWEIIGNEHHMQ